MFGLLNEIRFAWRGLARSPGFTLVAVVTLALGIGATTAVFTLVDTVLLRAMPYPESDRLISIQHTGQPVPDQLPATLPISPGLYRVYGEHARSLASIAMYAPAVGNFTGEGEPERIEGLTVTPSLFDVLGSPPLLGRRLLESDAEPGADPVVVIGHSLWQSRFGGDPGVLEQAVTINGINNRIVGVMPRDFAFPDEAPQYWTPQPVDQNDAALAFFGFSGIARLAASATVSGADAEMEGLISRLDELVPDAGPIVGALQEGRLAPYLRTYKEAVIADMGRTLWTLLGMVAFVLLIACANVANLLLVRAEGRQRDFALRAAVGASRGALVRSFLAESLGLALAGGALGVAIAYVAVQTTVALAPPGLPRVAEIGIDVRILAFAAAVSLLSAVAFGLFPALRYGRGDLSTTLKEGGARGGTAGRERHRVRNSLVVAQVTLALVLLVASGLMFRSFSALLAVDPGFDGEGVLTVRLTVPAAEVPEPAAVEAIYRQLLERLAEQPQVRSVGAISNVPLGGQAIFHSHGIEDHPTGENGVPPMAFRADVDPGYFETLSIPLLEGRTLTANDGADGFRGVVVSRAYARRWWPDASAIGRRVQLQNQMWEIVGIVGDVRNRGLQEAPEEMLYLPTLSGTDEQLQVQRTRDLVVRVDGAPAAFLPVVRREIRELNPRIPLANPRTMEEVARAAAATTSFTMAVLGSASVVALLLGLVGIYGVVSYVVANRTREIGVRIALGASGASVRRRVVWQGLKLTGVGVAIGLAVAMLGSRLMESLVYGVSTRDPLTYAAVALSLVAVAALASWIPAQRAASVEPAIALRRE
jgi:putative ABC transport system permease protein